MGTPLEGHTETVLSIAVTSGASSLIVSGGEKGELSLWSSDGATVHRQVYDPDVDIASVVCSNLNPDLLYASLGERIIILDRRQLSEPVHEFQLNEDEINQLALNEKEDYLAACDDSGNIKVVNLFERRLYKTLRKHTNICAAVSFRPSRPWDLFSGGYDSKLIQWDFSKGRSICMIDMMDIGNPNTNPSSYLINPPFIHSLGVSRNGKHLACGTENSSIQLFSGQKRNPEFIVTLHGHDQGVSQVSFPQFMEHHLLSGGNDGKLLFWDLEQISCLPAITNGTAHSGSAAAAAYAEREALTPFASIEHGAKVNWLTCGSRNNEPFIVVADNAEKLTVYPYPT